MIQRIQTLYLIGCVLCVAIATFGLDLFHISGTNNYVINAFGTYKVEHLESISAFPSYLASVFLLTAFTIAIFLYKNLKKQFRLVQIAGFVYAACLLGLIAYFFLFSGIPNEEKPTLHISSGFYIFFAGFSLIFLAQKSIKKDIQLLDSLNRLR
jgi:glucan phosphoethanolaminetransferase (alkaline phosphatase superfamily)